MGGLEDSLLCSGENVPNECFPTEIARPFDMIVNSKFDSFKRLDLAADVPKLALVTYIADGMSAVWPTFGTVLNRRGRFRVERLDTAGTARALSRARVGGIFSAIEGACYSSTEYLLAGLPVVSTPSLGGRDVWYSPANSVIVQPTREAVAAGVAEALRKLDDGTFNRASIRADAITLARAHRARFVDHFAGLLRAYEQAGVNASEYFASHFVHKTIAAA